MEYVLAVLIGLLIGAAIGLLASRQTVSKFKTIHNKDFEFGSTIDYIKIDAIDYDKSKISFALTQHDYLRLRDRFNRNCNEPVDNVKPDWWNLKDQIKGLKK